MRPRRILTLEDTTRVLDDAAGDNALAVVTLQGDGNWRSLKCRFLERDPQQRFFVLDVPASDGDTLSALQPGRYVGISFRRKSRKVLFTTVVEATGNFMLDDRSSIPAVRYRWPDAMTELQRRAYYRTPVSPGVSLLVHLWKGGTAARTPAQENTLQVLTGEALDLSCGGTLIRVSQIAPPTWPIDTTLGVELHLPDGRPPILIDAYYRGVRHDDAGKLCIALQFVGLELMRNGHSVLRRITGTVQQFHRATFAMGPGNPHRRPTR